jgi:hypothetical protein
MQSSLGTNFIVSFYADAVNDNESDPIAQAAMLRRRRFAAGLAGAMIFAAAVTGYVRPIDQRATIDTTFAYRV